MLQQSVIEKVFFADSYTGNESLNICRFEWFRPSVASNPEQAQAIRNIVNQTSFPAPYVLFGPPGTGKTSTLAEAIGQIYKLRPSVNVLAVAASNSVTNELTSRVLEIIPKKDVYRIFARSYARKIKYIDRDVLDVSNLRSMISDKKNKKKVHRDVKSYRVVLCTTSTAAQFVDANISRNHFSYIFIDECGFAKEISSLVPIMGIGVHDSEITASIVLAGDPKQLGPVILCDYLNETSHSVSLLERITDKELYAKNPLTGEYDPNVITQLRNNFRSHPALLELPNRMFYAGQLRAKASPDKTHWAVGWDRLPNRTVPLIFHHVVGEMKQDENSSSMYNEQEAEQVLSYVEIIMNDGICGKKLEQTAIGIITPYASQVRYLKDLLNMRGWKDIEVGSTEQYQGREKPIMLMSTVRTGSKSVGFLADPKRLNVSLTRAQALMIVVGDLETLRNNRHWAKFIGYCRQNNAVVPSVLEFPVETVALNTESFNSSGSDMRAETSNNTKTPEIDYTILPNQITACTRPVESGDLDADTESDSESGSDSTGNVIVEAELHNRTVETTQIVPAVTGQDNGTLGVILEIANIIVGYVLWPRRPTRPI
ncbi:putative helicase MOV-10 [Culex quinquefasciatus]|uniref:putative helicase MOV-10 n=1 Tax=Culex quinquefasciatus TaxID=7176 RepID=UPI0018E3A3CE|nr:putative helicase MOV-10 [Culex quinquefasciatus]XP_039449827.1 putative helicase MOV-10 [Culex pipiens pallens]